MTSSEPEPPRASSTQLGQVAQRTRATVSFVVPTAAAGRMVQPSALPAHLRVLASVAAETGGTLLPVAPMTDLSATFRRILAEFRSTYVLYYTPRDVTRDGYHTNGIPYNYGDKSGLYGEASEFGCGQEAAVIAQSREFEKAITGPVAPENVHVIGELFRAAGVRVAPFQAFGQPVEIK